MKKNKKIEDYMSLNYEIAIRQLTEDDGGGWTACIPQLGRFTFIADGVTKEEALKNLELLKRYLFEEALKKGTEIPLPLEPLLERYSGKFMTRIPIDLHIELSKQAQKSGMSLNSYMIYLLTKYSTIENVGIKISELIEEKILNNSSISYDLPISNKPNELKYYENQSSQFNKAG